MPRSNKKLVFTDSDFEATDKPEKQNEDTKDDVSSTRKSKRLAHRQQQNIPEPSKKKSKKSEIENDASEPAPASKSSKMMVDSDNNSESLDDSYDDESENESVDIESESGSDCSEDMVETQADRDFIVDDKPRTSILNNPLLSLFGNKKRRGRTDKENDYNEIYETFMEEKWFSSLEKSERKKYVEKMMSIESYDKNIPSVKELLDLDICRDNLRDLLIRRYQIDALTKLSFEYQEACRQFTNRLEYYTSQETINNQDNLNSIKQEIMEQAKFKKSMKDRILSSHYDNKIKSIMYDKYMEMECTDGDGAVKIKQWLETVLSIPHQPQNNSVTNVDNEYINKTISEIMTELDNKVYGMNVAKEEFVCMIANILGKPKSRNKAIGLYGPPGIGKTLLALIISKVLKRPMVKISLGGVTDSSFLEGHDFTYIGSQPGCVTKAAIQMGCTDGIIYFDEVDKISKTHHGKEIEHSLLHITDFTQNHDFRDKYMPEIPIDLSNYIFLYSMNTTEKMDSALVSRIPIIRFDGYTDTDKIEILEKYMLPELLENYGMKLGDVLIPRDITKYLISNIQEIDNRDGKSGVRGLKNVMNCIMNRVNFYRLAAINGEIGFKLSFKIKDFKIPYTLDMDFVQNILQHYNENSSRNNYNLMYI